MHIIASTFTSPRSVGSLSWDDVFAAGPAVGCAVSQGRFDWLLLSLGEQSRLDEEEKLHKQCIDAS